MKGGRTSTTWNTGSSWNHGETKTIRVPELLADQIMAYARLLDNNPDKALLHGNERNEQEIILSAIAAYIQLRQENRQPNQHGTALNTQARTWDELRKFEDMVKNAPQQLRLS